MVNVVNQNVPICPECKAGMHKRHNPFGVYYICADCKQPWRVIDSHKSDCEVVITNNNNEALVYLGGLNEKEG